MRLNFKSFGSGTPVVILHGLFGSLGNWQTFARQLSSEYRVFSVDLRNHGKSPHSDEHSYQAMADDVYEFLSTHHLEKAHILGHSMGGKAAMQFAAEHPQRVLKLLIVDIAPRAYSGAHDRIADALLEMDLSKITKREEADALLSQRISEPAVRQFLLKNLDRTENGFIWKMNLKSLHANYSKINAPITSAHPVNIPVFVIRGGKSDYVSDNDMELFRKIFPQARLITIPNAGHWVHADAPDDFYNVIREILSDRG